MNSVPSKGAVHGGPSPACEAAHTMPSLSALRPCENCALEAASLESGVRDRGCSRCQSSRGTDGTMTWLEVLLVVALLLIALGLTR
jgi:hypothetical protein